jgi:hypothetical protein
MKRRLFAFVVLVSAALAPEAATGQGARPLPPGPTIEDQIEDEYVRYELLKPSTNTLRVTHELSVVTAGATSHADVVPAGAEVSDVSVIDLMTGAALTFKRSATRIDITLARPVPKGGQARLRVITTLKDARGYRQQGQGSDVAFDRPTTIRRGAVVLPKGFELIRANIPVQVIQESDGRISTSFMALSSSLATISIRARALKNPVLVAHTNEPGQPRPPQAPPDAAPASQPMDQIRVTERAAQDREIVYFLKQPETHAFSLYHDYTASREGEHQYVNVVRTGSTVSDPSAMVLDTGEVLKTRILTGADIAREKIEIDERVEPDTEVVLIPFTPVTKGASIRLRISETYTDPARYALINGQLMWHRSYGRNRNDMVLPAGWYLTTSSIPAVISEEPDGRIRLSFWNGRPDNVDVLVKGAKR